MSRLSHGLTIVRPRYFCNTSTQKGVCCNSLPRFWLQNITLHLLSMYSYESNLSIETKISTNYRRMTSPWRDNVSMPTKIGNIQKECRPRLSELPLPKHLSQISIHFYEKACTCKGRRNDKMKPFPTLSFVKRINLKKKIIIRIAKHPLSWTDKG